MSAVNFEQWAVPDLKLPFGGRTYSVRPPTVEAAKQILAAAVLGEVKFGLHPGPVPGEIVTILSTIGDAHPALGDEAYAAMVADGVPAASIDRMSVYATFYWARGREYADIFARLFWTPRDVDLDEAGEPAPKDS
ncbi:DUF7426 family protein [Microbacterium sp.]|uniref:DUF7426 family protein n=1 Tax=Microbacterium sp. TaxID=51671 RepID=UPI003F70FCB9